MTPDEYAAARESYSYPPARLVVVQAGESPVLHAGHRGLRTDVPSDWGAVGSPARQHYSSIALDSFHEILLNGNDDEDLFHGLLSVSFWGYASGSTSRITERRAIGRARWLTNGKGGAAAQDPAETISHLRQAHRMAHAGDLAGALRETMRIRYLGVAFGSKLLAFMTPNAAGVYDRIVSNGLAAEKMPALHALHVKVDPTSERGRAIQAEMYAKWCAWCTQQAAELNTTGRKWSDWNGTSYAWRTIDVERAWFSVFIQRRAKEREQTRRQSHRQKDLERSS